VDISGVRRSVRRPEQALHYRDGRSGAIKNAPSVATWLGRPLQKFLEDHVLLSHVKEPFGTMALVCACFGLRISECLALRWSDVDWLNGYLRVERGIVEQIVDDVKTDESRKSLAIAPELLHRLKVWKQYTEFSSTSDWIFASPLKIGRLPYSYTGFWRELDRASKAAGLGHMGTHTFRHSYRMWIDAIGTPVGVQQKPMRHSDIRTTMNIYGDAGAEDMRTVHGKVVQLALASNSTENGTGDS
jgi:integrase